MAGRPTKFNAELKQKFLEALLDVGGIEGAACKIVGINHATLIRHKDKDPEFAKAVEEHKALSADTIEAEAYRRAVQGVDEPVFFNGVTVGHVKRYSDRLLDKLLTAAKPDKYGNKSTVSVEGKITHEVAIKAKHKIMGNLEKIIESTCEEVSQPESEGSQPALPELQSDCLDMDDLELKVPEPIPKDNEQ